MNTVNNKKIYNIIVVGGGVSGTALFYSLSKYSDVSSIALLDKNSDFGQVNSRWNNNSQTLHIGDIETNYSLEKASFVKPASLMTLRYAKSLERRETEKIIFPVSKMVLAVGDREVVELEERYEVFKKLYPELRKIGRDEIAEIEPHIVKGRKKDESVLALYQPEGYAVDFGRLAQSFVKEGQKENKEGRKVDTFLNTKVIRITKENDTYTLVTNNGSFSATAVVFNTDAYSLYFAKSLGYGKNFSLIPVAGNFYFSRKLLNGKVYTMQDKKLPFAAVHGDPDIHVPDKTRWGPSARLFPVLESRNIKTAIDYFRSASLFNIPTIKSFMMILSDMTRAVFLIKNFLYEIPFIGKMLFVKNIQKIVPNIRTGDIEKAKGFGGMRLQRVDNDTHELKLGEGKIVGKNIIFNMTPSPGASAALFNGMRDAETLMSFFKNKYAFAKCQMENDFAGGCFDHDGKEISENTYVS